ncbi:hypothetical protein ONZ51_g7556 [Trametes cubensis]|uniref:F-box domain-containing protein n=1 Tax=Trametes cubensis TaxID=1111947 RepID=A0AAD7TQE5_9APHY|nr:hypothetical protein ONZ51_g7556 [Trametes cubensis]
MMSIQSKLSGLEIASVSRFAPAKTTKAQPGMFSLNTDVLFRIAAELDFQSLQTWRMTCRAADEIGAMLLRTRYNGALNRHLADPDGFRSVLRATMSVVSGSTVLHIIDQARSPTWAPNDLDIYAPLDGAGRVASYLIDVEHYTRKAVQEPTYDGVYAGFKAVIHLSKGDLQIDVIQSITTSALYPLPFFWSTHVMNYFTADMFCVVYPTYTFQGRGLLNPAVLISKQYPTIRTLQVIGKYQTRGYDFRVYPYAWAEGTELDCTSDEGCPRIIRFFGDRYCCVGSLDTVAQSLMTDGVRGYPNRTRMVRWWRGGPACGDKCTHGDDDFALRANPTVQTHQVPVEFYLLWLNGRPAVI